MSESVDYENTAHRGGCGGEGGGDKKPGHRCTIWLLAFPRENSPNFPRVVWDKEVTKPNII